MDTEDLDPIKKKPVLKDLQIMSIEALRDYIDELRAEIRRAEETIAAKDKARSGAEAFFKKPTSAAPALLDQKSDSRNLASRAGVSPLTPG